MFKKEPIIILCLSFLFINLAHSGALQKETSSKIIQKAKGYVNSISCSRVDIDISHILPLTLNLDANASLSNERYAVIWSGDIGCNLGSGTSSTYLLIVVKGAGSSYFVDSKNSSPNIKFNIPIRDYKIAGALHSNALFIIGNKYGPNDANCCPSVQMYYTMGLQDNGDWNVEFEEPFSDEKLKMIMDLL